MEIKLGDPSLKKKRVSLCYQIFCLFFALHVKVPLRISKFLTEVAESNFEFWWLFESEESCSKIGTGSYIFFNNCFVLIANSFRAEWHFSM